MRIQEKMVVMMMKFEITKQKNNSVVYLQHIHRCTCWDHLCILHHSCMGYWHIHQCPPGKDSLKNLHADWRKYRIEVFLQIMLQMCDFSKTNNQVGLEHIESPNEPFLAAHSTTAATPIPSPPPPLLSSYCAVKSLFQTTTQ